MFIKNNHMNERYSVKEIGKLKGSDGLFLITAHDASSAKILEEAGVQMVLVGDSVSNTIFGYNSTIFATPEMILHHLKAVANNTKRALVVADMPFLKTYDEKIFFETARVFMQEGGAQAIKVECYDDSIIPLIKKIVAFGVPVVGHIGLTPQLYYKTGGYGRQGKTEDEFKRIAALAKKLEEAGVFCLLLECVEEKLAGEITAQAVVPAIGIGSGKGCDGQAHVFQDIVGLSENPPKHAKVFAKTREIMLEAVKKFMNN
jgi:3-methyl-2-oxobutanoate hydroxymethyltransferase